MFRKREPAPKMKKNMKMMPIPVDFRMSRLFRFIPFYSAFILQMGSREVTWTIQIFLTLFHVIDVGFNFQNGQFLHFWEKFGKDEIEKLQNWIKFITKRFDPF